MYHIVISGYYGAHRIFLYLFLFVYQAHTHTPVADESGNFESDNETKQQGEIEQRSASVVAGDEKQIRMFLVYATHTHTI